MVEPIAEPMSPQPTANHNLRLRVLAVDGGHIGMALRGRESISHNTYIKFTFNEWPMTNDRDASINMQNLETINPWLLLFIKFI